MSSTSSPKPAPPMDAISEALPDYEVATHAENENPSDTVTSAVAEKPSEDASDHEAPMASCMYAPDHVVLVRNRGHWLPQKSSRLRNSLLHTMGLLELANAGDFAANVWNEIPVPIYAIVFMALGGTLALVISVFALKDTLLSWENVSYLGRERASLKEERARLSGCGRPTQDLDVLLDANFRELGSEIANRFGLDIFSGFGAFIISIGTYMAIAGANYRVWHASNLLSGYIGNAPIALYALFSSSWSIYIFRRNWQHRALAAKTVRLRDTEAKHCIGRRVRNVHVYTAVSAVSCWVGGAASMMTATMWEGYVILIPVIISSIFYNTWLRRNVSYDRPPVKIPLELSEDDIVRKLREAGTAFEATKTRPSPLGDLVCNSESLEAVLDYFEMNDLLEHLCVQLLKDPGMVAAWVNPGSLELNIDVRRLLDTPKELHPTIFNIADETLRKQGPRHFEYRQRYLAEVLGSMLRLSPK